MKKITLIQAGLFALLTGGAPLVFAFGGEGVPLRDWDCVTHWERSSAIQSCKARSVSMPKPMTCKVLADCKMMNGRKNYTYGTIKYTDTDDLVNCDGHLKVGSC